MTARAAGLGGRSYLRPAGPRRFDYNDTAGVGGPGGPTMNSRARTLPTKGLTR
jgi:hypothetical protein